jgi:hypothetical protein
MAVAGLSESRCVGAERCPARPADRGDADQPRSDLDRSNQPPSKDNGTHSGINRKPAALRMVQRFLLPPTRQATDGCLVGGSPAPCDCATGACN